MRHPFPWVVLLGMLCFSGCARHNTEAMPPSASAGPDAAATDRQKVIVTAEGGLTGKVVRADQNLRFVVLNFPIGHLPALEQPFNVYRAGLKVGEVKVSGPQQDDNIVADIVAGQADAGDEVRDR